MYYSNPVSSNKNSANASAPVSKGSRKINTVYRSNEVNPFSPKTSVSN